MKLRRCQSPTGPEVQAWIDSHWVSLKQTSGLSLLAEQHGVHGDLASDLLAVLKLGHAGWQSLEQKLRGMQQPASETGAPLLPVEPASFRDFMLFEKHVIDSSRGYVKRFMPRMYPVTQVIEGLTGKPFKRFRPHKLWYQQPIYYFGNHLNFGVSGDQIRWPSYTKALDYELELGAILARPLFNASENDAADAIGGFVVLNDVSARDVQKDEMECGFGPQKAKHFYSTMSATVVTADEVLRRTDHLCGRVSINGQHVTDCSTQDMKFSMAEAIAFASKDEPLHPGELFGSGTLPGGTGMENGRWLSPGDNVTLSIDAIGAVTNTIEKAS